MELMRGMPFTPEGVHSVMELHQNYNLFSFKQEAHKLKINSQVYHKQKYTVVANTHFSCMMSASDDVSMGVDQ